MLNITPVPAFQDNYIWALHNAAGHCAVVDPGDAAVVEAYLQSRQLTLSAILVTHHHPDHTGGLRALCAQRQIPVYGPHNPAIRGITQGLGEADRITLDGFDLQLEVLEVPGHTLDHIAFHAPREQVLFCGDTLFHCGCGRLFEGTPAQMLESLDKLAALPGSTQVYCTHEYTLANMAFAQAVEPTNSALSEAVTRAKAQRQAQQPTLPTSVSEQRQINPFLRSDAATVREAMAQRGADVSQRSAVFAAVRAWKDSF